MDEYMGIVKLFSGNFAPQGWLFCNGALLQISQYEALYTLIGITYGGDGNTTFALPDLRTRVAVGSLDMGVGVLPPHPNGAQGGSETTVLNQNQLPQHTHLATAAGGGAATATIEASANSATESTPGFNGANTLASLTDATLQPSMLVYNNDTNPAVTLTGVSATIATNPTVTLAPTGGNASVPLVQPIMGMNYIICVEGIWPSRP